MHPKEGQEARLKELLQKLSTHYHEQPGYQSGYILNPYSGAPNDDRRWGRVGLWDSEDAAEHAAQTEHSMALRSELSRIVAEDSHFEFTFEGTPDNA
jgi:heme-degrading monooxygenase HmoA